MEGRLTVLLRGKGEKCRAEMILLQGGRSHRRLNLQGCRLRGEKLVVQEGYCSTFRAF